jgi:hypothetical protein
MTHAIQDIEQVSRWTVLRDSHLHVCTGQVWLTRDGELADHVLGPGQGLDLHHGDRVTAEPWHPGERVRLALLPATAQRAVGVVGLRGAGLRVAALAARGLAGGLLALARSADAMASRAQGRICAGESMASAGALK